MHILGFNCFAHDAAAAIMRDGELLGMVEEERFQRRKHVGDFPVHSIRWCCEVTGIKPAELDHIVFYWQPGAARRQRIGHLLRYFPRSLSLIKNRLGQEMPMLRLRAMWRHELGVDFARTQMHFAPHHLCHAASTFLTSPFDRAAILSIDAAGEWDCTWLGTGDGLDLRCRRSMQFPNSLGLVYGAVTEFLGFKFASGEGKVMGLAPFGAPEHPVAAAAARGDPRRYRDVFRQIIRLGDDGQYQVDLSWFAYHYRGRPHWFSRKFYREFGPARPAEGELTQHYMDVAAALQQRTEEAGVHLARWLRQQTGLPALCLAGGVCLNAVMNAKILAEAGFDEVSIHPAANDAGTSLGACFWLWNTVLRQPRRWLLEHAYLGPWIEPDECAAAIRRLLGARPEVRWQVATDAPRQAAEMLAAGKIVGWFQGRMELGPRALGNRSILADPRPAAMKDLLNQRVKFRESFRPYAPSVLADKVGEWFTTDYPAPYMILVYDVRPEKRAQVAAITHVDGTGRVQAVSATHNPRFYRLISEFAKLTGVPMVLNTSFNVRGEPIVHRPEQAIECFLKTGLDALFLGDYLLTKPTASAALALTPAELARAQTAAATADNRVN